jgi:transposase
MWVRKGTRPIVTVTGSHQKTIVFGALAHDGRQMFRQYDKFDQHAFLDFLKCLHKKFGKILVYADRAPQHCRSKLVQEYLKKNRKDVIVDWFPKGSPQYNAVEECWKQGKYDLLVSRYHPSFADLKDIITRYYRTRRFNLDILKYMQRKDC